MTRIFVESPRVYSRVNVNVDVHIREGRIILERRITQVRINPVRSYVQGVLKLSVHILRMIGWKSS